MEFMAAREGASSARRRRDRQLRAWHRHVRTTGGHGAGDGPPPQRSRSEEKSGGGAVGGGVAREAQRHKWPERNSSVGRAARASVGCLCAAAAGRSCVCGCWSSFTLVGGSRWRLLSGQLHGVLSRPFGGGSPGGAEEEEKAKKAKEESLQQFLDQLRAKARRELEERLDSGGASSKRKRKRRGGRGGRLVPPPAPLVAALVVDSGSGVFATLVLLVPVHLVMCSLWLMTGPCCSATRLVWTRRTVFSSWLWQWHMQCWFCWFRSSRCVPFCHGQALMLRIMDSIRQKDCYSVGWFYWCFCTSRCVSFLLSGP